MIALTGSLFSAPASAAEMPPQTPSVSLATAVDSENSLSSEQKDAIYLLTSATDREARTFDSDEAVAAGVDEQAVAEYAAAFQNTAGLPSEGQDSRVMPGSTTTVAACTGKRGYTGFYGWGWQTALNSCETNLLIGAMGAGGGGAYAISGVLVAAGVPAPAAAVTAAVGGLITAGVGVVSVCKAASYTKNAIYLDAFVTGGVGCWGQ